MGGSTSQGITGAWSETQLNIRYFIVRDDNNEVYEGDDGRGTWTGD